MKPPMDSREEKRVSKFLSYVLRHNPAELNITLDEQGYAPVDLLLKRCAAKGYPIDRETLDFIVEHNNKKRFAFNDDLTKIRASQGHSISIELGYTPQKPPELLYHGTAEKNLDSIRQGGLQKKARHHVHLSKDTATALQVGSRHGKPVILTIKAVPMYEQGREFFLSDNGVWLTDEVPLEFIIFPGE